MACRLVGAKPLFEPMLEYVNSNLRNKSQWNLKQNSYIFIQEMHFKISYGKWRQFCLDLSVLMNHLFHSHHFNVITPYCVLLYEGIWVHCYPWLNKASVGDRRFYICNCPLKPWWRHSFRVTGPLCAQRPVTRSFDVFFDLRLNKWLSKESRRRWFEMPLRSLWPHCNDFLPWLLYSCMQYIITSGYLQLHFTVLWMM